MSIATITELGDRLRELGERTDILGRVFTGDVPEGFDADEAAKRDAPPTPGTALRTQATPPVGSGERCCSYSVFRCR